MIFNGIETIKGMLQRVGLSAYFLAIPLAAIIIFLLPAMFNKYKAEISSKYRLGHKASRIYIDINNDGFSEVVQISLHRNISTSVIFFKQNFSQFDQANLNGLYIENHNLLVGDFDNNNNNKEVYIFTYVDTQLYINSVERVGSKLVLKQKFVTNLKLYHEKQDLTIYGVGLVDLNGDGYKEVIFTVIAGFKLQPRAIYAWDSKNETIIKSPKSYAVLSTVEICDIDNDNIPELLAHTWAPGNTNPDFHKPYNDQSAWLMIFDNELNYKFEPIEFPGFTSRAHSYMIKNKNKNYIAVYWNRKLAGKELIKTSIYDTKLNLITERNWDVNNIVPANRLLVNHTKKGDIIWHIKSDLGIVEQLDLKSLETIKTFNIYPHLSGEQLYDIDNDGENEILVWSNDNTKL